MFFLIFLPVPQDFLLIPLSRFIYLRFLSVRTFILNLFLPPTENANQNKSEQIFVSHYFLFFIITSKCNK